MTKREYEKRYEEAGAKISNKKAEDSFQEGFEEQT
jgi:hypothetical protein